MHSSQPKMPCTHHNPRCMGPRKQPHQSLLRSRGMAVLQSIDHPSCQVVMSSTAGQPMNNDAHLAAAYTGGSNRHPPSKTYSWHALHTWIRGRGLPAAVASLAVHGLPCRIASATHTVPAASTYACAQWLGFPPNSFSTQKSPLPRTLGCVCRMT